MAYFWNPFVPFSKVFVNAKLEICRHFQFVVEECDFYSVSAQDFRLLGKYQVGKLENLHQMIDTYYSIRFRRCPTGWEGWAKGYDMVKSNCNLHRDKYNRCPFVLWIFKSSLSENWSRHQRRVNANWPLTVEDRSIIIMVPYVDALVHVWIMYYVCRLANRTYRWFLRQMERFDEKSRLNRTHRSGSYAQLWKLNLKQNKTRYVRVFFAVDDDHLLKQQNQNQNYYATVKVTLQNQSSTQHNFTRKMISKNIPTL